MSIDEAIECERNHRLYPEYHDEIAEWLEKLKTIENIMLIYNANWYADEDNGVPDCEVLESIWNVIQDNGLDIDIEQDYRKGYSDGYNKAIDDFASKLIMHFSDCELSNAPFNDDETDGIGEIICETIENAICGVKEIAEQLKVGVNHERIYRKADW